MTTRMLAEQHYPLAGLTWSCITGAQLNAASTDRDDQSVQSDSANLDNVAELMVRTGVDLEEALMVLVPEAYRNHPDLMAHYPEVYALPHHDSTPQCCAIMTLAHPVATVLALCRCLQVHISPV